MTSRLRKGAAPKWQNIKENTKGQYITWYGDKVYLDNYYPVENGSKFLRYGFDYSNPVWVLEIELNEDETMARAGIVYNR